MKITIPDIGREIVISLIAAVVITFVVKNVPAVKKLVDDFATWN